MWNTIVNGATVAQLDRASGSKIVLTKNQRVSRSLQKVANRSTRPLLPWS